MLSIATTHLLLPLQKSPQSADKAQQSWHALLKACLNPNTAAEASATAGVPGDSTTLPISE